MAVALSLAFYSLLMAVLSFLAGLLPFWILNNSHTALPYLIAVTSGLLLSTCLNIVLPEALSNLNAEIFDSKFLGPQILLGFVSLYALDVCSSFFSKYFNSKYRSSTHLTGSTQGNLFGIDDSSTNFTSLSIDEENPNDEDVQLASFTTRKAISNNMASFNIKNLLISVLANSTTLGLLLHCLTDGIILATSLISSDFDNDKHEKSNSFIIILAIFLHKLPASFSLTSILLGQQLSFPFILFHLFLFSISAPIGAWVTYLVCNIFDLDKDSSANTFILLYSTGAFLYVSFHTFISSHSHKESYSNPQENTVVHNSSNDDLGSNTFDEASSTHFSSSGDTLEDPGKISQTRHLDSNQRFIFTMLGMALPFFVAFLHDD